MQDANVDYIYEEYKNMPANNVVIGDQIYEFDGVDKYDYENSKSYNNFDEEYEISNSSVMNYFEQRPDLKMLFDELIDNLSNYRKEYYNIVNKINDVSNSLKYCSDANLVEKYGILIQRKEQLETEIFSLENKKCNYLIDGYNYNNVVDKLASINHKIEEYLTEKRLNLDVQYDELINNTCSETNIAYYSRLKQEVENYNLLLKEKELLEEEYNKYICSAITLDDIKDKLKNYNSLYGTVPAGEWDTIKNVKYAGYGYEVGILGSFEGPQGKETGYDSRKGAEKDNYRSPDSELLELLSKVTDSEGNILYPIGSFKKGGKYYYHIFGVNDDGSINWDLFDNPRFGCKMLGDYLVVGCDQRINRERGSKVITSLGPAIVFDYGYVDNLEEDPSHIDIGMDEVLFWLKDFSHNQDRTVKSLIGIYDWCTSKDYTGIIDLDYEHMERNYVNNLNVSFNTNFVCVFDRDDFNNMTNYDSQEEFVYTLTYK